MKRAVIVHRWGAGPTKDWYQWIRSELEKRGYEVHVPAMPDTEHPRIEKWVPCLAKVIKNPDENTILIGHSVGCQMILRFLETLPSNHKVRRVVLVAGFVYKLMNLTPEEWKIATPWFETPIDFIKVKKQTKSFTAIFSDNDLYVPLEENRQIFNEQLGARIIIEKGKGHITEDDKIIELPILLELIK